jgi:GH24 family phage-related lysozyme (muramidase)
MSNNKQQTAVDIKQELKTILGDNAFSCGTMKVSSTVSRLVKAVYYMDTQIKMLDRWIEDEQGKRHIEQVRQSVKNILNETYGGGEQ